MAPGKVSAEFAFLMQRENVPDDLVQKLVDAGIFTIRTFANLVDDVDGMRRVAKEDLKLSPDSLGEKVKIASLVCAWKAAQARTSEMDKNDAQADVQDRPKQILAGDHEGMRTLFEEKCWELQAECVPGRSLVEKILGMLEKRHLKAETLSEAISAKEDEHQDLQPVWTPDGRLKTLKQSTTVPLPATTEELRARINTLAVAW